MISNDEYQQLLARDDVLEVNRFHCQARKRVDLDQFSLQCLLYPDHESRGIYEHMAFRFAPEMTPIRW